MKKSELNDGMLRNFINNTYPNMSKTYGYMQRADDLVDELEKERRAMPFWKKVLVLPMLLSLLPRYVRVIEFHRRIIQLLLGHVVHLEIEPEDEEEPEIKPAPAAQIDDKKTEWEFTERPESLKAVVYAGNNMQEIAKKFHLEITFYADKDTLSIEIEPNKHIDLHKGEVLCKYQGKIEKHNSINDFKMTDKWIEVVKEQEDVPF